MIWWKFVIRAVIDHFPTFRVIGFRAERFAERRAEPPTAPNSTFNERLETERSGEHGVCRVPGDAGDWL